MDHFEKMKEIGRELKSIAEKFIQEGESIYSSLTADEKTALLAFVFKVLKDHAEEGGSYRFLLYQRFNLDESAYAILQIAGALKIHNIIVDSRKEND